MKFVWRSVLLLFLASCSIMSPVPLPELITSSPVDTTTNSCNNLFVLNSWQFVHSITFETEAGYGATIMGVTVIEKGMLKTVLMGVEGFVLFEAEQGEEQDITVYRALPPFDKSEFAAGLMRDVRALFFVPGNSDLLYGTNVNEKPVCRYIKESGQVTDVIPGQYGWRRINVYDRQGQRSRSIVAGKHIFVDNNGHFPESIELVASGALGYTLHMKLLSADKL